jgi:hypothetical protein
MFRRRPLARAAVVGGAAYYAGKKGAESAQREADQNAQIADLQAQQAAPAPAPSSGGMSEDSMNKLKELADLHTQGILTDAEFEERHGHRTCTDAGARLRGPELHG